VEGIEAEDSGDYEGEIDLSVPMVAEIGSVANGVEAK
jgi:hypothetical protein